MGMQGNLVCCHHSPGLKAGVGTCGPALLPDLQQDHPVKLAEPWSV